MSQNGDVKENTYQPLAIDLLTCHFGVTKSDSIHEVARTYIVWIN